MSSQLFTRRRPPPSSRIAARWAVWLTCLVYSSPPTCLAADTCRDWITSERSIRCLSWFATRPAAVAPRSCGPSPQRAAACWRGPIASLSQRHRCGGDVLTAALGESGLGRQVGLRTDREGSDNLSYPSRPRDSSAQMRVERNELSRNSSPARWLAVTNAVHGIISTGSRARCGPARES